MTKKILFVFCAWTLMLTVVAVPLRQPRFETMTDKRDVHQFSHRAGNIGLKSGITQAELNTVLEKTKGALSFLNRFWCRHLSCSPGRFTPPGVRSIANGQAYYSAQEHTIYFNPAFFVQQMRAAASETETDGDMAFIVILGHEYGHAVQSQLGLLGGNCLTVELQADRMAGAFTKAAQEAGLVELGDLDEATYTFFSGRDSTDKYYECAHGTGTQRVNAFHTGLKGGLNSVF
jgi:hypothetical protein